MNRANNNSFEQPVGYAWVDEYVAHGWGGEQRYTRHVVAVYERDGVGWYLTGYSKGEPIYRQIDLSKVDPDIKPGKQRGTYI